MNTESSRNNRRIKNYLLIPSIQLRLGFYAILLSVITTIVTLSIIYANLYGLYQMVLELTDISSELQPMLADYMRDISFWLGVVVVVYFTLMLMFSVLFTHRLVGPTRAFRRHIKQLIDGRYESRVILRKNDAFVDVADDLNALAHHLEQKYDSATEELRLTKAEPISS